MDGEDRPNTCSANDEKEDEVKRKAIHTQAVQEGELAMNTLLHRASNTSADKATSMDARMLNFLCKIFPSESHPVLIIQLSDTANKAECVAFLQTNHSEQQQIDSSHAFNTSAKEQEPCHSNATKTKRRKARASKPIIKTAPSLSLRWPPQQK